MRILMIPSWYPSAELPKNGSFFAEQVGFLASAGHEVVVLVPEPTFITFWRGPKWRSSVEGGVRVLRFCVPSWPIGLRAIEGAHYALIVEHLLKVLIASQFDPEVVHCHSIYPATLLGAPLSKALGVPLVLTEHRPSSLDRPTTGFRGRRISKAVQGAAVRSAVSSVFCQKLHEHWDGEWELLELPVPDAFFELERREPDQFTVLHVSHLDPVKRVNDLLEAFAEFSINRRDAILRVGGGCAQQIKPYRLRARELGIEDRTYFLGQLSREQVASEMVSASVFALTSEVEAGGTVISESQACGAAVVATETYAGCSSTLENYRFLAPVGDTAKIARQLELVAKRKPEPSAIRDAAKMRFSRSTFVAASERIYRQALDCSNSCKSGCH